MEDYAQASGEVPLIYPVPMVFRGQLDRQMALLSVKDRSASLAIGHDWVAAWDLGGRLYSLWKAGRLHRRGLNGRMVRKWRDDGRSGPADGGSRRVQTERDEADAIVQEAAGAMRAAVESIAREPFAWTTKDGQRPDAAAVAVAGRCARFDAAASRADAETFSRVFRPVGILPPDQYLSIVLQATEGCSFGTCTFCDLYRDGYRVKSAAEFARHAEAVRDYLGDSARLRSRSIFLGAANALAVPMSRLVEFLEAAAAVFGRPVPPVHAFVDGFTGARKSAGDYAVLRAAGLRRVYVGLESGHDPLLEFVRKPASRDLVVQAVRAIKDGGVAVGVIVMIGLGGTRFAAGHVEDTVAAVNAMALGPDDLLFFSDLVEVPGTAYPGRAAAADVGALDAGDRQRQLEAIRAGLSFPGQRPHLARYDVEEFVY